MHGQIRQSFRLARGQNEEDVIKKGTRVPEATDHDLSQVGSTNTMGPYFFMHACTFS